MKEILWLIGIGAILLAAGSAGCISLGSQTTDIVIGNETVGKITLTPLSGNLFSNASLSEKVNLEIDIFGVKFSKDGITKTEADSIVKTLQSSNISSASALEGLGLNISTSTASAGNVTAFLEQIKNMPLTNTDNRSFLSAVDINGTVNRMEASADQIAKLLGGLFGL